MRNISLLLECNKHLENKSFKIEIYDNKIVCRVESVEFDGVTIKKIIQNINTILKKFRSNKVPIIFSFGDASIKDKLSFIMFECLCYLLITKFKNKISIDLKPKADTSINSIQFSPITDLNTNIDVFTKRFKYELQGKHFRKLIDGCDKADTNYLGILQQDIDFFLKHISIAQDCRDDMSEVIVELVGNAIEHGMSDCLLDIDVTDDYIAKSDIHNNRYLGINIAIVNFSEKNLNHGLMKRSTDGLYKTDRHQRLEEAYTFHKSNFSEEYTENDFYTLASFQDKISGRSDKPRETGGVGLTKLIKSLQEKSHGEFCYMITGNRAVMFKLALLGYDNDEWLGFNEERNFFSNVPDKEMLSNCPIYMPGTAYSLNFMIKKEEV